MYESQVSEYKYEIERLARELQDVKKKYYMQKKKEQAARFVFCSTTDQLPCQGGRYVYECFYMQGERESAGTSRNAYHTAAEGSRPSQVHWGRLQSQATYSQSLSGAKLRSYRQSSQTHGRERECVIYFQNSNIHRQSFV